MVRLPEPRMRPAEEAFVVTVGVSHRNKDADCARVLQVLERAGFRAGVTSNEAILVLAEQVKLTEALADNDPEGDDIDG